MRIKLTSVLVDDQDRAARFYTDVLGFVKKRDAPMGEERWVSLVAPEAPDEVELLLEAVRFPPAVAYQKALYEAGVPLAAFAVADVDAEYERLRDLGVVFRDGPTKIGPTRVALFDDTCGNLIEIFEA